MPRVSQTPSDTQEQIQLLPPLNPHLPHKAFPPERLPIVLLSLPLPLPHPRSPLFLSLTPLPLPSLILIATFPSSNTFPNRPDLLAAHFSLKPSGQSLRSPDDLTAWSNLLQFGRSILFKPTRGGKKHNLASTIKKRTTGAYTSAIVSEPQVSDSSIQKETVPQKRP